MNIDGVDFWATNHHVVILWDDNNKAGPFVVMIDERVRAGKNFKIYIQGDLNEQEDLFHILNRQCDMKHECNMSVLVYESKTRQPMYDLLFKVVLKNLNFGEIGSDPEINITYHLIEAIDKTNYGQSSIRKVYRENMHNSNGSGQLSLF